MFPGNSATPLEAPQVEPQDRQQVEGRLPGGSISLLDGQLAANLAPVQKAPVLVTGRPRQEEQLPRLGGQRVGSHRSRWFRQSKAQRAKAIFWSHLSRLVVRPPGGGGGRRGRGAP